MVSARFSAVVRTVLRWLLGAALIGAGVGHLTAHREEFRAQVPGWFPVSYTHLRAHETNHAISYAIFC